MKNRTLLFKSCATAILFVFILASGCASSTTNQETKSGEKPTSSMKKDQLRHVVLLKFKESASPEAIAKVKDAFVALKGKIPQIKDLEWGLNNSPEGLDKGFTHCFFLTFDSEEDRSIYLPHPDHKAFGGILGPVLEDVLVIDYWVK